MKKLVALLPLAALFLTTAPASSQSKNIHENVDPYTGLKVLFLEIGTRTCPGDPSPGSHDPEVHLLFNAMQNQDGTVSYAITPELDYAGYTLGLHRADTMDTLIDGAPGTLHTNSGSTTTHRYAGNHSYPHETIPFDIAPDQLTKLATAESFQFRVNGPRQELQRCTDSKRLRDLAEFVSAAAEYGPPAGSIPASAMPLVEDVSPTSKLKKLTLSGIATQPCPGDPAPTPQDADVHLAISANQRTDGGVWYFFITDLSNGPLLNLHRGDKLQTQMDGKTASFNTINGTKLIFAPDASGHSIQHETIAFHVHQSDVIALSKTPLMEFRLGPDGTVRRCVYADQFKHLNEFIQAASRYEPPTVASAR